MPALGCQRKVNRIGGGALTIERMEAAGELNHRVKNTLATVQAIAAQTLSNSKSITEARSAFEARLMALSRARDLLTRELGGSRPE